MASSIPYDPEEFENNNPFAEPEQYTPSVNVGTMTEEVDVPPEEESSNTYYGQQVEEEEQSQEQNSNAADNEEMGTGRLVEEDLKKLLPERFTNKYLMRIHLREIEENKPNNPILRFDASVRGLPKFREKIYKDIRRTYNEVHRFNEYLILSNLEVFVPVIPSPITSYPAGGEDERKQQLYNWLEWFSRITRNPILVRDEEFVYFIESDFGYSVINSNRKQLVASGLMRKTMKQLNTPYDPYQELALFRPIIKSAYLLCQRLNKTMDKNQKLERQLLSNISELGTKLKGLAQFETVHPGMRNLWEKLAKVTQFQADLILFKLISDMGSLGDGAKALSADFFEIKEALTNRYLIMRELIQAEAQTKSKHVQATKIKSRASLDPIRAEEAIRSFEYAQKAEESLHMQVKRISGEMMFERKEVIDFTEKKMKTLLKQFTLNRVEQHRKLLNHFEKIRLDVRIIDENGGLSRLNREHLSQMKHNLAQSQAANGDLWSSRKFRSLTQQQAEKEEVLKNKTDIDTGSIDAKKAASMLGTSTF